MAEDYINDDFRNFYDLEELLSNVGFADRYRAINRETQERVVIKFTNKEKIRTFLLERNLPTNDEEIEKYLQKIKNEAKYARMIQGENNDNIVKIRECYDFNEVEFAIIMELCDCTLYSHIENRDKGLNSEEIYYILNQLNNDFRIMAENKLLHRTLRIDNILLKYQNNERTQFLVKLKLHNDCCTIEDSSTNKLSQNKIGNNRRIYAPEVLIKSNYTETSDLWSVGVLIYLLSFREYPFTGKDDDINRFKKNQIKKLNKIKDPDLNDLFTKLITLEPRKRISWEEYFKHPFFRKKEKCKKYYDYNIGEDRIGIAMDGVAMMYKAKDKITEENRAIKIFSLNRLKDFIRNNLTKIRAIIDRDMKPYIDNFYDEVNFMKILQGEYNENKNAVTFYEYFHSNEEFSIVMELCDSNLQDYTENKKLDCDTIHEIITQLNNSFRIMVKNKIIHRAIKLKNIYIISDKLNKKKFIIKLKVTVDSCLKNKISPIRDDQFTRNKLIYAPEIIKRERYDEKSDLWSLGVLIYHLYFGEHPFKGETKEEILKNISKGINIKTNNKDLDDLISKLLIENPSKRITWKEYFEHKFFKANQDYKDYYDVIKRIGNSGFGVVYEAKTKKTGKKKALRVFDKSIIKENIKKDLNGIREVTEEDTKDYIKGLFNAIENMKILQGFNFENINTVKFTDYFNTKNEFVIVTEYCDTTLFNYIRDKKNIDLNEIQYILRQLNNSFKILADNHIVHRKIKPEHIFLKYDDENKKKYTVKLIITNDCALLGDTTKKLTKSNILNNRFIYAPEVLEGGDYVEESDLWSLGVLIYFMREKKYPFEGKDEKEVLEKIKNGIMTNFSKDDDFNDLMKKLLTLNPRKRMNWKEYFNHNFVKES